MPPMTRRFTKEEFVRGGDVLIERKVRPSLTAADEDKFVAIDFETGEYELNKNEKGRRITHAKVIHEKPGGRIAPRNCSTSPSGVAQKRSGILGDP